MDEEKVSKLIKESRKKLNLTQEKFAQKYNVTPQAVSKWENGKNLPDITTLKEICKDSNTSIDNLLLGKKNKSHTSDNYSNIDYSCHLNHFINKQ